MSWDRTPYKYGPCAAKMKDGGPCELGRRKDSPYCEMHHGQQATSARWLAGRSRDEWEQKRVEMAEVWADYWASPDGPYPGDRRVRCLFCLVPVDLGRHEWLNVHHVYYSRAPNEGPGDLAPLCPLCHTEVSELTWELEREMGWSIGPATMAATYRVMYTGWGARQQRRRQTMQAMIRGQGPDSLLGEMCWEQVMREEYVWPRDGFIRSCPNPHWEGTLVRMWREAQAA